MGGIAARDELEVQIKRAILMHLAVHILGGRDVPRGDSPRLNARGLTDTKQSIHCKLDLDNHGRLAEVEGADLPPDSFLLKGGSAQ